MFPYFGNDKTNTEQGMGSKFGCRDSLSRYQDINSKTLFLAIIS